MTKTSTILDLPAAIFTDPARDPAQVYVAGLAAGSQPTMAAALDKLARIALKDPEASRASLDWSALRYANTAAIRAELAETCAVATANKLISALRGVLRAAWQLELMSAEDYHRATDLKNITGQTIPPGRAIEAGEMAALLGSCPNNPGGVRDAAIICVMYCGLRRFEVTALDKADFADKNLKVRGKRRKERLVPVVPGADSALADWLSLRGDEPGPLFVSIRRGGHLTGERLTPRAINHILELRAAAAGVKEIRPHDFRRSCAGDLLDAGADIATVANLLGHSSIDTTRRYDRRGERAKQKAVGLLHLPYRRRVLRND